MGILWLMSQIDLGSGSPRVSMMKAAQLGNGDDLAVIGRLNLPWHGSVAIEGQMWPRFMVIAEILDQDPE